MKTAENSSREYKDYTVYTSNLVTEMHQNIAAGKRLIKYTNNYMEAALQLSMYDHGERTFEMVENEREVYVNSTQLWLSKAVNTLMYLQSTAMSKGRKVFREYVDRTSYTDCVDLISSIYQSLMEFFHDDYTEAQAQELPADLPKVA